LGAIENRELQPGLHFKIPLFQSIKLIPIRPVQTEYLVPVGEDGAITKDNQTIGAKLTVFYVYNQGFLVKMWKDYGQEKLETIIAKTMLESFKGSIGKYDIFSLPVAQDSIRAITLQSIKGKMVNYPITITELKITNYDWSEEFDKQITQTMERAQQVKQKQQELLIAEQEAQKEVKQAEAAKTAMITKAEGEKAAALLLAEAKEAEGRGIQKYNEAVQKNMTLEVQLRQLEIEKIKAEKWNGQYVPTNHYGPIPIQTGAIQPSKG
ncbi:MAG: SPFH domain-containing protein, partial [Patescibacteria group bacterium]|nr:SPFH domain-containing protein [Patescibacteria group bacterium]